MRIRRLGWSGIEVEHGGETLLVDYIQDTSHLPLRDAEQPFPSAPPGSAAAAAVTHLHPDHADPAELKAALRTGAPVFRPVPAEGAGPDLELTAYAEAAFAGLGLDVHVVEPWTSHEAGPFVLHAVPAVDGFGDPQVSWVVEAGGRRIVHAGDTLFHGVWWHIARRFGPFDRVFLPINGAVIDFPFLQPPRAREAIMTPEEAARAAHMLGARVITPIHYGVLHRPPGYVETHDPVGRLRTAAGVLGVAVEVREPGESVEMG